MHLTTWILVSLVILIPIRTSEEGTTDIAEDGFCEGNTCQEAEYEIKAEKYTQRLHRHEAKEVLLLLTAKRGR